MSEITYETRKIILKPHQLIKIGGTGKAITCLEATSEFELIFGGTGGGIFSQGLSLETKGFHEFFIKNMSDKVNKITLAISDKAVKDARLNFTGGSLIVKDAKGKSFSDAVTLGASCFQLPSYVPYQKAIHWLVKKDQNKNGVLITTASVGTSNGMNTGYLATSSKNDVGVSIFLRSTCIDNDLRYFQTELAYPIFIPKNKSVYFVGQNFRINGVPLKQKYSCYVTFDIL